MYLYGKYNRDTTAVEAEIHRRADLKYPEDVDDDDGNLDVQEINDGRHTRFK